MDFRLKCFLRSLQIKFHQSSNRVIYHTAPFEHIQELEEQYKVKL
jgi:hypothetical protein